MSNITDTLVTLLKKQGTEVVLLPLCAQQEWLQKLNHLKQEFDRHPAQDDLGIMLKELRDAPSRGLSEVGFKGICEGKSTALFTVGPRIRKIAIVIYDPSLEKRDLSFTLLKDLAEVMIENDPALKKQLTVSKNPLTNKSFTALFKTVFALYVDASIVGLGVLKQKVVAQSKQVFTIKAGFNPAEDSLPVFADALLESFKEHGARTLQNKKSLEAIIGVAIGIVSNIDTSTLSSWRSFCGHAQDMAWRGYSPREILTAAIRGSESPYLQAIGRKLSRYCRIDIEKGPIKDVDFNPFESEEENQMRHKRAMNGVFSNALNDSIEKRNVDIFYQEADAQNMRMLDGTFTGWCAKALQKTASLLDSLFLKEDVDAIEMKERARRNFRDETSRSSYGWGSLKKISDKIIDEIKDGNAVTHSKAVQIANDNNAGLMADSLSLTMSSEALKAKLDNVAALNKSPEAPTPNAPAQKMSPKTPAPKMSAPGMGMGGNSASNTTRNTVRRSTANTTKTQASHESRVQDDDKSEDERV